MNSAMKILWLIGFLFIFGCKKYPEGPALSLRAKEERLSGDWRITKYSIGGIDSLNNFNYEIISIGKFKKRSFETSQMNDFETFKMAPVLAGNNKDLIGYCSFNDNKKYLAFFGVSISPINSTPDSSYIYDMFEYDVETSYGKSVTYQILKLKESEFKLKTTSKAIEEREIVFNKIG